MSDPHDTSVGPLIRGDDVPRNARDLSRSDAAVTGAWSQPPGFFMAAVTELRPEIALALRNAMDVRGVLTLAEAAHEARAWLRARFGTARGRSLASELDARLAAWTATDQPSAAPPADWGALLAWARASGAPLTATLRELSRYLPPQVALALRLVEHAEIAALLRGDAAVARSLSRSQLTVAQSVARAFLAREKPPAAPPAPPPPGAPLTLRTLEGHLRARLDARPAATQRVEELKFDEVACAFTTRVDDYGWSYGSHRVTIDLARGAPAVTCDCRRGACPHQRSALAALLRLLEKPGRGRDALEQSLGRTPWERSLQALDGALSRAPAAEAEAPLVSWRVGLNHSGYGHDLSVEAYVHRALKRGGWSSGTRQSLDRLAFGEFPAEGVDARVAELLSSRGPVVEASRFMRALALLAGHPRVFQRDDPERVVSVRVAAFGLAVAPTDDGWTLGPTLDGAAADLSIFLDDGEPRRDVAILGPGELVLARLTDAQARVVALLGRAPVHVPSSARAELVSRLASLEKAAPLQLPPDMEGRAVPPDDHTVLRLTPRDAAGLEVEALARPLAGGAAFTPGEGPERISGVVGVDRQHTTRDLPAERSRAEAVLAALPLAQARAVRPFAFQLADDDALDLVVRLRAEPPPQVTVEWPKDRPLRVTRAASAADLRVVVEQGRDWFGLSGEVTVDGEKVPLAQLLQAVRAGRRYVSLGERGFLALSAELRRRLAPTADVAEESRGRIEIGPEAAPALEELTADIGLFEACVAWRDLQTRLARLATFEPALPPALRAELRPYQRDGFVWLSRLAEWGVGAVLADDMGLGKTVQALAVLLARAERGPALVVAPTSVSFNWLREAARFAPTLRMHDYRALDRARALPLLGKGDVVVVSWSLLARDADRLAATRFATLVLDEAHALKNPATRRAQAARGLDAEWRVALTGTPVENRLGELWSLFRVVTPGLFGSWERFRERFAAPIEKDGDAARRVALSRVVRPFILRRTKEQVTPELPPRTEIVVDVELSAPERRLYDDARLLAAARLAGLAETKGEDARFQVLAELTRLRQLACNPRLVDEASQVGSAKLAALLELVAELKTENHRALVFSQFTSHLALVREALDARGVPYQYLDGSTPAAERERRVDAFQRGEGDCFLVSLKAGGTGLNLTAADYVIHLDPWWNPAVEDQASSRAHRLGQERPVTVFRLVSRGTIEQAILELHASKRDLVAGVLSGTDAAGRLSTSELVSLIRSGEDAPPAPETDASAETDAAETDAAETAAAETAAAETDAAETDAAETDAAETDAAETDAAETDAAETDAAETDAAETDAAPEIAAASLPAAPVPGKKFTWSELARKFEAHLKRAVARRKLAHASATTYLRPLQRLIAAEPGGAAEQAVSAADFDERVAGYLESLALVRSQGTVAIARTALARARTLFDDA